MEEESNKLTPYEVKQEKEFAKKAAPIIREFENLIGEYRNKVPHITDYSYIDISFDKGGGNYIYPTIRVVINDSKGNNTSITFSDDYETAYVNTDVITVTVDQREFTLNEDDDEIGE